MFADAVVAAAASSAASSPWLALCWEIGQEPSAPAQSMPAEVRCALLLPWPMQAPDVGFTVGLELVGDVVGLSDGFALGLLVGNAVGLDVGLLAVDTVVGLAVGLASDRAVGAVVGLAAVGLAVDFSVVRFHTGARGLALTQLLQSDAHAGLAGGDAVGLVGAIVRLGLGLDVGLAAGLRVGGAVGLAVGDPGSADGLQIECVSNTKYGPLARYPQPSLLVQFILRSSTSK